jgi:hypothetical protein
VLTGSAFKRIIINGFVAIAKRGPKKPALGKYLQNRGPNIIKKIIIKQKI